MENINKFTERNIEYWSERVREYKERGEATLLDNNMRLLEIETVSRWLNKNDRILDIGCGNGISTIEYAKHCKYVKGIDLSSDMVSAANTLLKKKRSVKNVSFEIGNILELDKYLLKYNVVVSTRCLINLPNWRLQKKTIIDIHQILPSNGKLIMIEGSKNGIDRINTLRRKYSLSPLREPWYNKHLDNSKLFPLLRRLFYIKDERHTDVYFLVSRILYPFVKYPKKPKFEDLCNKVGMLLADCINVNIGTTLLTSLLLKKRKR